MWACRLLFDWYRITGILFLSPNEMWIGENLSEFLFFGDFYKKKFNTVFD